MNSELRVFFLIPRWEVSGVTSVNLDLAAALRDLGVQCSLVVEEDNREACPYELPRDIPCHSLLSSSPWWRWIPSDTIRHRLRIRAARCALGRSLAANSPVALIPGYAYSMATPDKSWGPNVGVFGVIHADDDTNLNFAINHGREWAACICVSERVAARVRTVTPWLAPVVIPNGVPCVFRPPIKSYSDKGSPLRVIYAGRLEQKQKRVRDLATLVEIVAEQRLDVIWEIAGEGSEAAAMRTRLLPFIESGAVRWHGELPREAVRGLFAAADVMLLLSEYEGMPMTLLEAMAEGCAPVVTEGCDAGAELVRSHDAGFVLPTGDMRRFAETLHALTTNREQLAKIGERAWNAVAHGEHNSVAMGKVYRRALSEWWISLAPKKSN